MPSKKGQLWVAYNANFFQKWVKKNTIKDVISTVLRSYEVKQIERRLRYLQIKKQNKKLTFLSLFISAIYSM